MRIGALGPRKNSVILPHALKRLAELGYVEGRNLELIHRSADGLPERFPALAQELIDAKCDLIFAVGAEAAGRALVDAKSLIPVVLLAIDYDPVRAGDISASILGGKPPGDISIELPTHITLTINLKTAKALGITVPKSMLVRADRVIE